MKGIRVGAERALFGGEQVQYADLQLAQEAVRQSVGEAAGAFENVVQVGLGEAGLAGEAAFGGFAAIQAGADVADEALVEVGEVHGGPISRRNRGGTKSILARYY